MPQNMDKPSRFWGFLTVTVPVHPLTAGNNIVVVVLTLTHRQNRVRGHWRTGSNNSGVEEYLRKQSDKLIQEQIELKSEISVHTYQIHILRSIMQTAMLTSASFAYTINVSTPRAGIWGAWEAGARSLHGGEQHFCRGRSGEEESSERPLGRCRLHNHRGHLTGQVQHRRHLRHCHRHQHRRWRWVDAP